MNELTPVLLELGLGFLKQFLASMTKAQAPQDVIDGLQAAITAVESHRDDVMSKADWEAQRG